MRSPPLSLNRTNSGSGSSLLYPMPGCGGGGLKQEGGKGTGMGIGGGGGGGVGLGLGLGSGSGSGSTTHTKSESMNQSQKENMGSPSLEAADLLYEYFPLSLDDWLVFLLLFFFPSTSTLFPSSSLYPSYPSLFLLSLSLSLSTQVLRPGETRRG